MSRKNKVFYTCIALLLSSALLPGCTSGQNAQSSAASSTSAAQQSASGTEQGAVSVTQPQVTFDADDSYTAWDEGSATAIAFSGTAASVSGAGVSVSGNCVTITSPGTYVLTGTLEEGQLIVDAGKEDVVRLVLNGVSMHCSTSSPLYAKQAGKTVVSLAPGTENTLSDGSDYVFPDAESDEPNATLFCKDDLTLNGTGSLTINAQFNNGIASKDTLKIMEGQITIDAADDAILGRDLLVVQGGTVTLRAQDDGLKSTNDTDAAKGSIVISGGQLDITSQGDGIQAYAGLFISGGELRIVTASGSANAAMRTDCNEMVRGGFPSAEQTAQEDETSAKGLKAGGLLSITDGTFDLDTLDDALHSNGALTVSGGTFTLATGDDALHADGALSVSDGTLDISACYEGLEGTSIDISGGEIALVASDDGINASDGSEATSQGMAAPGSVGNSNCAISISGGTIYVDASGDGLDSNGSITMSGGTLLISGPVNDGNGALDFDGSFEVTGGLLIAAGSAGMVQTPTQQGSQNILSMTCTAQQAAGTPIVLTDKEGNTLASFTPNKAFRNVILSLPDLVADSEYALTCGDNTVSFTAAEGITYLNESGVTTGGMGDNMGGIGNGRMPGGDGQTPRGGNGAPRN
ncbi:carbohydrate-binding domain-containing protein [Clostridium sp. BSD2780061688st1 E8]|uniref:carbohydrate-binding domain-containing protein n=1 Tax=unclassified Clostridium TaxID=2614128 RepID=UPI0011070C69|nr:carbohydrate-binding domain-containing protein [Clostridium sp. BSD2780061688st1 E8]